MRIFCGRTINTEKEEATFNKLKTSTNLTSNHHSDHILTNAIVRLQMQKELNGQDIQDRESMIHKIYQDIKKSHQNTIISFDFIKKHPLQYQRLLQKQADYLSEGRVWWKEVDNEGVEFYDVIPVQSEKQLHHFRSYSMKQEDSFVKDNWYNCLQNANSLIPAFKLKIKENENKDVKFVYIKTLNYFREENASISHEAKSNENDATLENPIMENPSFENNQNISNLSSIQTTASANYENSKLLDTTFENTNNSSINSITPDRITLINPNTLPEISPSKIVTSTPVSNKVPFKPTRGLKPKKQIVHFQIHKDMKPRNLSGKLSYVANLSSKVLGNQDYILEFDKQRKNLRAFKTTENFNLYKDSVAIMEIRIKMREEELQQM